MSDFRPSPTGAAVPPQKCLFGVTILLIEDSRAASEALRLFAMESGARVRRADSLASAHRHLAIYRPNIVIVDLGLPDGSGLQLIKTLAEALVPFQGIIASSGNEPGTWEASARDAGASACIGKPIASLRAFQDCLLGLLPDRGVAPAVGPDLAIDHKATMAAALAQDLARAMELLQRAVSEEDLETIAYCAQFLGSLRDGETDIALGAAARSAETGPTLAVAQALVEGLSSRLQAVKLRGAA